MEAAAAAADLAPARAFLAAARALHFSIPEELGTRIEGEMADAKQRDAKNVNQETFHRWLNVSAHWGFCGACPLLRCPALPCPALPACAEWATAAAAAAAVSSLLGPLPPPRVQLARLLSVSHGEGELTALRWDQAVALEERRQQRLATA